MKTSIEILVDNKGMIQFIEDDKVLYNYTQNKILDSIDDCTNSYLIKQIFNLYINSKFYKHVINNFNLQLEDKYIDGYEVILKFFKFINISCKYTYIEDSAGYKHVYEILHIPSNLIH